MGKLSSLTPEEERKLRRDSSAESQVDAQWMLIAEFGSYYGLDGIKMILGRDEITIQEFEVLIVANRKLWDKKMLDVAEATLASAAAAQAGKKAGSVFSKLVSRFIKGMKVKE